MKNGLFSVALLAACLAGAKSVEWNTPESLATTTCDPATYVSFASIDARDFSEVVVRMKVEGAVAAGNCQLFWAGPGRKVAEVSSVSLPVTVDGAFHDYRFPVGANRTWRGRINHFRFDPVQVAGLRVTIESVRLR